MKKRAVLHRIMQDRPWLMVGTPLRHMPFGTSGIIPVSTRPLMHRQRGRGWWCPPVAAEVISVKYDITAVPVLEPLIRLKGGAQGIGGDDSVLEFLQRSEYIALQAHVSVLLGKFQGDGSVRI